MKWQYAILGVALAVLSLLFGVSWYWPPAIVMFNILLAELILSVRIARENERLVPIFFGVILHPRGINREPHEEIPDVPPVPDRPGTGEYRVYPGLFGTGIILLPWPFFRVLRYPTSVQSLESTVGARRQADSTEFFEGDDVLTAPGHETVPDPSDPQRTVQRAVARARVGARVELFYQWNTRALHHAAKNVPPPGSTELNHVLQRTVDADFRRAVATTTLPELYGARKEFEEKVRDLFREPESVFRKAGLISKEGAPERHLIDLALHEVIIVDEHRKAVGQEQAAIIQADVTRHTARAERFRQEELADASAYKIGREGEEEARVRKLLFDAIRGAKEDTEVNVTLEALNRLSELGQGTSNTVLYQLPAGMTGRLSQAFGGAEQLEGFLNVFLLGLTPEQRQNLLREILAKLPPAQPTTT